MNVLMLSSSRCQQEDYLQHAQEMISAHLQDAKKILFIPYAGVTLDWSLYCEKVQAALPERHIVGIHQYDDPIHALADCQAIMVGGGNTFNLLYHLYQNNLITPLRQILAKGLPYVGWSAGSNICGSSIRTTNDMPIIQPPSFEALALLPVQINPHYSDYQPPGHNGETRAQRIQEFCTLEPSVPVIGIREGSALLLKDNSLQLLGSLPSVVFQGKQQNILEPNSDLSAYLNIGQ